MSSKGGLYEARAQSVPLLFRVRRRTLEMSQTPDQLRTGKNKCASIPSLQILNIMYLMCKSISTKICFYPDFYHPLAGFYVCSHQLHNAPRHGRHVWMQDGQIWLTPTISFTEPHGEIKKMQWKVMHRKMQNN